MNETLQAWLALEQDLRQRWAQVEGVVPMNPAAVASLTGLH